MSDGTALMERGPATHGVVAVKAAMEELKLIRTFVANEMRPGVDFGAIPGTGDKPTLLLPGAQKIVMFFNTYPRYEVQSTELGGGHVEYLVTTSLISRGSGNVVGGGVGSCCTMEKKYRYRGGQLACPECGQATVFRSKKDGGHFCWKAKGGCGLNFRPGDPRITGQDTGRVENPDIYDLRNTVLKMAKKRSIVDAAHGLGCLSEMFTQDIGDTYDLDAAPGPAAYEDAPQARRPRNDTGHGSGAYASPAEVESFREKVAAFVEARNGRWLDSWTDPETGELTPGISDLLTPIGLARHLLKWGRHNGHVEVPPDVIDPDSGKVTSGVKSGQVEKLAAILMVRHGDEMAAECERYADEKARLASEKWNAKYNPDGLGPAPEELSTEGG